MNPIVTPMVSPRSGRPVPNQYIIHTDAGIYFQSYRVIVGFKPRGGEQTILDVVYWNYSRTTSKYLHIWLRQSGTRTAADLVELGSLRNLN